MRPVIVSGLMLSVDSVTCEIELATISMAPTGKSHLMQVALILSPSIALTRGNRPDVDVLAKELDHYYKRLEVRIAHFFSY